MAPKAEDGGFTVFESAKNEGAFRVVYERGGSPGSVRIRIWDAQEPEHEAKVIIRDPNYLQTLLEAIHSLSDVWEKVIIWPDDRMRTATLVALHQAEILSSRVWKLLHRQDMRTLDDVCRKSPGEMLVLPGFGETALTEIRTILAQWDLRLEDDDEDWYERHKEEQRDEEQK